MTSFELYFELFGTISLRSPANMEQRERKTKATNADRCKRYRRKNADKYKINDALRKKRARQLLKINKDQYEEHKKKERERKRLAKLGKNIAINHHSQEPLDSQPSTSFSNSAVKSRIIKKVEKSLPKSPRRKKKVIKSLASKFNVKVKLTQKVGRKKNELTEQENQWLVEFLNRPDISYTTPGRRDNVYRGKLDKVKKFGQKRYLLWSIRDIMDLINGSKIVESDSVMDTFELQFGKKLTFRQLYDLFKRNKQYIFNRKIAQWSCLCEICENAIFLVNGLNKKLFPECRLPVTIHELVGKFSCTDDENCMTGKCDKCSSTKLTSDDFNATSDSDLMSPDNASDVEEEGDSEGKISYYEWAGCDNNKLQKVLFKKSIEESIHLLNSTSKTLKNHINVKRVQFNYCNNVKSSLAKNEILIHVDYSESYENKQQREIQSTYFGHTTFSISPLVATFVMLRTR